MGRAPCCDKTNVKRGPWSSEEDAKLKAYIDEFGTAGGNWIALPQKIGLKRCGKSCRLRWLNYLRPDIKHGGFSEEEDNIICSLYISIGSRWSIIAAQLPGRTDNDIKNYWNTRLKKKLLGRRKQSNTNHYGNGNGLEGGGLVSALSNSALERLQLHMQLENPFSFWPNLLPNQQKAIQTSLIQASNNMSPNLPPMENVMPSPQLLVDQHKNLDQGSIISLPTSMQQCGINASESLKLAELENFLVGDPIFDVNGCRGSLNWWSNELDSKSTSSNSWDSNHALQNDNTMFQDYELGYM